MKTINSFVWSVAMAAVMAGNGRAQVQDFRTDINPALLYYKSFILAPDLSQADKDFLFTADWRGKKMPKNLGALISQYDNQFDAIRQAAHATAPCDWGIDWSLGPGTLLPHLAQCKQAAITAQLRVMWDLQNGKETDAADDLVATMALARNCSRDGSTIAALVQIAIENILSSTIAANYYQFSPETMKHIADGFDAAPERGTLAMSVTNMNPLTRGWMAKKITDLQQEYPGDDAKVLAELTKSMGQPPDWLTNVWSPVLRGAGGTSEGLLKAVREDMPLNDKLAAIMALPEPQYEAQIKEFGVEVQRNANPLFSIDFPNVGKSRTREFMTLAKLAMIRAAAEYKLHGEEGLKSVMDPYGNGPFSYERFVFKGVDRGFKLKTAYAGQGYPLVLIFVEKDGPPFLCDGPHAGEAIPK